jgi:hypothetical protein
MTVASQIVELAGYRILAGERALQAQRIDGRVAVMDIPIDHDHRVCLINATSTARPTSMPHRRIQAHGPAGS